MISPAFYWESYFTRIAFLFRFAFYEYGCLPGVCACVPSVCPVSRGGQKRAPENLSSRFFWVLEIELRISSEPPFQSLTLALENSFDLLVCVQGVGRAISLLEDQRTT